MRLTIHEILQQVSDALPEQRAAVLQKNTSAVLQNILKYNFDANVKFLLPEGEPPFKTDRKMPIGISDTNLFMEARRLYVFIDGTSPAGLKSTQRETLFINLLEGLHYTEADLIVSLKDKKLENRYPGLTQDVALEAFPGLFERVAEMPTLVRHVVIPVDQTRPVQPLPEAISLTELVSLPRNAPTIVPRGEEPPKEKKPTSPKKLAAIQKAMAARRENAARRREEKAAAEAASSKD